MSRSKPELGLSYPESCISVPLRRLLQGSLKGLSQGTGCSRDWKKTGIYRWRRNKIGMILSKSHERARNHTS